MNKEEFYKELDKNDLEVTFIKKSNGETRTMKCTSNFPDKEEKPEKKKTQSDTLITVYDTELKDIRSFHSDSIIEVKPLKSTFGLLQE